MEQYQIDYKAIAQRIRGARKEAGLTQAELAEKIGISTNAVAKLETNLMTASLQTLVNIANVLGLDINYFLRGAGQEERQALLESLVGKLSKREKEFLIHIVNGLRVYNAAEGDSNSSPA